MRDYSIYAKTIFQERKITDYLAEKGIFPKREQGNRKMYICPVHQGDTSPSMIVFTDSEYENYYCFGCHSGTTIINLVADMENIDKRQSFKHLIKGLNIPGEAALSDFSDGYDEFVSQGEYSDLISMSDVEEISLRISVECFNFLKSETDFDPVEVEFFEQVLQKVDALTRAKDKKNLEKIYYFLVEEGIPYRAVGHYERKEGELLKGQEELDVWGDL